MNQQYELEGVSARTFHLLAFFGGYIQTENGRWRIQAHASRCGWRTLYKCSGCGRICCGCFGGAPDPRCDTCVEEGEPRGPLGRLLVLLELFLPPRKKRPRPKYIETSSPPHRGQHPG